jgi:glycosyltransferase involved in cell wall biosynthesis
VLPYKKASQSGIIPIAYNYNKLVVASNIDGLKEYVVDKKTGYLFDNNKYKSLYVLLNNIFANHNFIESENYISKYKNNFSINKLYDHIISFVNNE